MKSGILKCIQSQPTNIKKSITRHLIATRSGWKHGARKILKDGHSKKVIVLVNTGKSHGTKK